MIFKTVVVIVQVLIAGGVLASGVYAILWADRFWTGVFLLVVAYCFYPTGRFPTQDEE